MMITGKRVLPTQRREGDRIGSADRLSSQLGKGGENVIEIEVSGGGAKLTGSEVLTAGRAGLLCRAVFDSAWDGLQKTAVFSGAQDADVFVLEETFRVPAECLSRAGKSLRIGFYGTNSSGGIVIPTVWVNCGEIMTGAELSGMSEQELTPSLAAQIMAAAAEAMESASQLRADAAAGRFNGQKGDPGEQGLQGERGPQGLAGEDGVSPTATVLTVIPHNDDPGGAQVTISDQNGAHSFRISNGARGATGSDGADGTTFTPSVSSAGVISWTNDGNKSNPQSVDLVSAVLGALPTWQGGSY